VEKWRPEAEAEAGELRAGCFINLLHWRTFKPLCSRLLQPNGPASQPASGVSCCWRLLGGDRSFVRLKQAPDEVSWQEDCLCSLFPAEWLLPKWRESEMGEYTYCTLYIHRNESTFVASAWQCSFCGHFWSHSRSLFLGWLGVGDEEEATRLLIIAIICQHKHATQAALEAEEKLGPSRSGGDKQRRAATSGHTSAAWGRRLSSREIPI